MSFCPTSNNLKYPFATLCNNLCAHGCARELEAVLNISLFFLNQYVEWGNYATYTHFIGHTVLVTADLSQNAPLSIYHQMHHTGCLLRQH